MGVQFGPNLPEKAPSMPGKDFLQKGTGSRARGHERLILPRPRMCRLPTYMVTGHSSISDQSSVRFRQAYVKATWSGSQEDVKN